MAPHLVSLHCTITGPACSAKFRNHVLHYFQLAIDMKWTDDRMGASLPHRCLTLQLPLYAMHLGNGDSLNCKMNKSGTITKYMLAVGSLLQHLHPDQIEPSV
jgi:hypothetical protein